MNSAGRRVLNIKWLMSFVLSLQLAAPLALMAQTVPETPAAPTPVDLDLSSVAQTVAAPTHIEPTNIMAGGAVQTILPGQMITAAQNVALQQILNTGTQYLQLNDVGAAIGGGLRLQNYVTNGALGNLVIPEGVRASQNAAILQNLNLTGNLVNSGTFNIFSSNSAVTAASVNAANIYNNASGLISSTLASLTLNAANNIVNAGIISSAGSLNLMAGNSIINSGVMQAMTNVNLQAATLANQGTVAAMVGNLNANIANVTNSGTLQALQGSLSMRNSMASTLNINNALGSILARDQLSFSHVVDPNYVPGSGPTGVLKLLGGDFKANEVMIDSPKGAITVDVNKMEGAVNATGGSAAFNVANGTFNLNNLHVTGDPVIYFTGQALIVGSVSTQGNILAISAPSGSITINGSINTSPLLTNGNGGDVMLLSGLTTTVNSNIQTSGVNGKGGQVFISANNTGGGAGSAAITVSNIKTTGTVSGDVVITGTGPTGTITVSGTIDTSSNDANGRAGSVAISGPETVQIGTGISNGEVIKTTGNGAYRSGGIFVSSGQGTGTSIAIGSATNTNPLLVGNDSSVVLVASKDIRLGTVTYTGANPETVLTYGGLGIFAGTTTTFAGFPAGSEALNYTFTVKPQAIPTFTNGSTTWNLVPGGFQKASGIQSIFTTGNVTIDTNGDSRLLAPIVMPDMSIGGNITGQIGSSGNAASIVLVTRGSDTSRLFTQTNMATGSGSVITAQPGSPQHAFAGNIYLIGGAATTKLVAGGTSTGVASVIASAVTNTVDSFGGNVVIGTTTGTIVVQGDTYTKGTGADTSGNVTLLAPFVAGTSATPVLTAGNIFTDSVVIAGVGSSGGSVGAYSGTGTLTVGNINTSGYGVGQRAGDVILGSDSTTASVLPLSTGSGILVAGNIIAAGLNNANGGNIWLDSGSSSFTVGSLVTRSTSSTSNVSTWNADTGSGAPGTLLFSTNALRGIDQTSGNATTLTVRLVMPLERQQTGGNLSSILLNPTVTFLSGSSVLLDGSLAGSTNRLSLNLATNFNLGDISTYNAGSGAGGSFIITTTSPGASNITFGKVITSAAANNAGNIYINSTGTGLMTVGQVEAIGNGSGNIGGAVMITNNSGSGGGSLSVAGADSGGTGGAAGGNIVITGGTNITIGTSANSRGLSGLVTQATGDAGLVLVTAGNGSNTSGAILGTFAVNASSTAGKGGQVVLGAVGNNGSGVSLQVGNVNSSGTSGGIVEIVSLDTGSSSIGSITSQASSVNGIGGSIGVATLGALTVTGAIDTTNTFGAATSTPARSGSVFLSSGVSLNYASTITAYNAGNGSASGSVIVVSGGNASSITPAPVAGVPQNVVTAPGMAGAFTTNTSSSTTVSQSAAYTITVTPSTLTNYNPKGFNSFTSDAFPITNGGLRMNTGGDSYIVVPVISLSTTAFSLAASTNTTNAASIYVVSKGNIDNSANSAQHLTSNGSVTSGNVSAYSLTGNVRFHTNFGGAQPSLVDTATTSGGAFAGNASVFAPNGTLLMNGLGGFPSTFNTVGATKSGDLTVVSKGNADMARWINVGSAGTAGNVNMMVNTGNIYIRGNGTLARFIDATSGTGNGGNINMFVGQSVPESSLAGIIIFGGQVPNASLEQSFNTSSASATGGNIRLTIASGALGRTAGTAVNQFQLKTGTTTSNAGNIFVNVGGNYADEIYLNSSGLNAGNINLNAAGSITVINGAYWIADTTSINGQAGNITAIAGSGSLSLCANCNGDNVIQATGGTTGGNIRVEAPYGNLYLFYGGTWNVSTSGSVQSGSINLLAGADIVMNKGLYTGSNGTAGSINITSVNGAIAFTGNTAMTNGSLGGGAGTAADPRRYINTIGVNGNGGNITVNMGSLPLDISGNGLTGIVTLTSGNNLGSTIELSFNSSSTYGVGGNINVNVGDGSLGCFSCSFNTNAFLQLISTSTNNTSGNIGLSYGGTSQVRNNWRFNSSGFNGGNITIFAPNGSFTNNIQNSTSFSSNDVTYISANATVGKAGDVSLTVGSMPAPGTNPINWIEARGGNFGGNISITSTLGSLVQSGGANSRGQLLDASATIRGGNITVRTATDMTIGNTDVSATGMGGNINLAVTGTGNITLANSSTLNAQGTNAGGGNVNVTIAQSPAATASGSGLIVATSATINVGSTSGSAGTINVATNSTLGPSTSGSTNNLTLSANSTNGNGGGIFISTGSNFTTNWLLTANGVSGGSVLINSGGLVTMPFGGSNGTITVNGSNGVGGSIAVVAQNDLSIAWAQANGASTAGSGGNILLLSKTGAINVTSNSGSQSLSATGASLAGGQIIALAKTGITISSGMTVASTSAGGGTVVMNVAGTNAQNISANTITATGSTQGGNISLISTGRIMTATTLSLQANASGGGSTGGNIFLSQGNSANALAYTLNIGGTTTGRAIAVSAGTISGSAVTNENRFASVVGNFPGAVSGNNYTYTVSTGAAPTITDTTSSNTYTLQPGSLGGFGSFDIGSGNLTVVMPNKTFVAPLLVGGNIVANSVVGSGTSAVGLVGLGAVSVASTINNSNATAAGAAVMLVGSGAVSVTNGINTMGAYTSGTGVSGNVTLFGSSVSVTGFNNSVNNLASTIDTSSLTGSGGSVFVGSTSSITIGNWSGSTYTSMGEIDTYTSGSGKTAGSVSLLGLGNIQTASVKAGGLSNGNGGQITVASSQTRLSGLTVISNTNTVGSLVNRSTTTASAGAVGAGLNGFNNDTGTGIAAGIQTSGSFKFLADSYIMDDATKASNYTGAIRVNVASGSGAIAGIYTNNASGTSGHTGAIALLGGAASGITLNAASNTSTSGNTGMVALSNSLGSLTIGSGINTSVTTAGTTAGAINVDALGTVSINGHLNSSATSTATPGNTFLWSRTGDVSATSINVSAASAASGSVVLYGQNVIISGASSGNSINASSTTAGGGAVTIYPIGNGPFRIGYNSGVPQSGTFAKIVTSGTSSTTTNVLTIFSPNSSSVVEIASGSQIDMTSLSIAPTLSITAGKVQLDSGTINVNPSGTNNGNVNAINILGRGSMANAINILGILNANTTSGTPSTINLTTTFGSLTLSGASTTGGSATGGNINITSAAGVTLNGLNPNGTILDVSSTSGNAGAINVNAAGNILVTTVGGGIIAANGVTGSGTTNGYIRFNTTNGTINTFDGVSARSSFSATGTGNDKISGQIVLLSTGNITTGTLNVGGLNEAHGGTITVTPTAGNIDVSAINVSGYTNVVGGGNINTVSNGGTATLTASAGTMTIGTITGNDVGGASTVGAKGAVINLTGSGNITVNGAVNVRGLNGANSGTLTATSSAGSVTFNDVVNMSADGTSVRGFGGSFTVTAGNGNVNTQAVTVDGFGTGGYAGFISLTATGTVASAGSLSAQGLQATGSGYARGGSVALVSSGAAGGISFGPSASINVSSGGSSAGHVVMAANGSGGISLGGDIIASGVGTNQSAGAVLIGATGGGLTVQSIDARGLSGARGGWVTLASLGTLSAGSAASPTSIGGISTSGSDAAGPVTISSGGAILTNAGGTLNINTSAVSGRGGAVNVGSAGNNGTASIQLGNINTSGTAGGAVEIVSIDSGKKTVSVGSITTQASASNTMGGSVGIAVLGALTVSGAINTTNTFVGATTAPARSGSVFLSSGTSINYTSTITAYNAGNGSGSGQVILISGGNASSITPAPTANVPANVVTAAGMKGAFTGVGSGSATTLTSSTITISPTAAPINYNPNGYNAPTNTNVTLTMDTNADSFLIAPLLVFSTVGGNNKLQIQNGGSNRGLHSSTTNDSYTIAATGDIQVNSGINMSGASGGGSISLFSITGNINANFFDGNNKLDARATTAGVGGNVTTLAPLGSYLQRESSGTFTLGAGGSVQGGNILAVTYSRLAVASAVDSSMGASGVFSMSAGDVNLIATNSNIWITSSGTIGTASVSNQRRYVDAISTSGNGGNISLIVGQSSSGNNDPWNQAGSGYSGIITANQFPTSTDENSFNASSTLANGGDIYQIIISGPSGYSGGSGNPPSQYQLLSTAPNGTGGNVSVSVGGQMFFPLWIVRTTGSVGGDINIYSINSIGWRGALISTASVGKAGDINLISATGSASLTNNCCSTPAPYIEANGGAFGGNVTLLAPNGSVSFDTLTFNSNNDNVSSMGSIQGGNINLLAGGGDITISKGLNTSSSLRNAGDVTIKITKGNLIFSGSGQGTTTVGNPNRFINAIGNAGSGGDILVNIAQSVTETDANARAGIIFSQQNAISSTREQSFNTSSTSGQAGNISITIDKGQWGKFGSGVFSDFQLISNSTSDNAGNVTINVNGTINLPLMNAMTNGANGGNISITSTSSFTSPGFLQANASAVRAGSITANVTAFNTGYLDARGGTFGGNVSINASAGTIVVPGAITSQGQSGHFGNSRGVLIDTSATSKGGSVNLTSSGNISFNTVNTLSTLTAEIDTSSAVSGGNVNIAITGTGNLDFNTYTATGPNTQRFINTQGGSSNGGNVTITLANGGISSAVTSYSALSEASINTSSQSGNAGNIIYSSAAGSAGSGYIQFIANSMNGANGINNGGNISVSAAGAINSNWAFSANGANGGNISISSSGGLINLISGGSSGGQGAITANGLNGTAGSISINAQGNLSLGYVHANGSGTQGYGGNVFLTSRTGTLSVNATAPPNTKSLSATGSLAGGQMYISSSGAVNLQTRVDVSSSAGQGGTFYLNTFGGGSLTINGTGVPVINASGVTGGGNIALITTGTFSIFNGSDITVAATGSGASGGNIFVSSTASIPFTNANLMLSGGAGGATGYAVLLSSSGLSATTNVAGNIYAFPSVTAGLLTAATINASPTANYRIVFNTGAGATSPFFENIAAPGTRLAPGMALSAGVTMNSLTFVTPTKSFLAPLAVNGNITINGQLIGSGTSSVAVYSTGNITVANTINNSNTTASGANVTLLGLGALQVGQITPSVINSGINTAGATSSGTGNAGNITLIGSSVLVNGSAGSLINTSASLDLSTTTGNGGSLFVSSSSTITIGDWSGSTLVGQGEIDTYTSGSGRRAGNVSLIAAGTIQTSSIYAGGLNNGSGGQLSIATTGNATVGSLVVRSTTNSNVNGTAGFGGFLNYDSDTGTGTAGGIITGGQFSFLSGAPGPLVPVVLADASISSGFTSGINLTLATASTPPGQIVTANATGSSGPVAVFANNTDGSGGLPLGLVLTSSSTGNSGSIVAANSSGFISLGNNLVTSVSSAAATAGTVILDAATNINGGTFKIDASAPANPGSVVLSARNGTAQVGSITAASTALSGGGVGGNVLIYATSLNVSGETSLGSGVSIDVSSASNTGGSISLFPVSAANGYTIVLGYGGTPQPAGTKGALKASGTSGGSISLRTSNTTSLVEIANGSSLNVDATSGTGGSITLFGGSIQLDAGNLGASGVNGNGGTINITANPSNLTSAIVSLGSSNISASSSAGLGGTIALTASQSINTANLSIDSALGGGSITLTTDQAGSTVVVNNASANATVSGNGGNITLNASPTASGTLTVNGFVSATSVSGTGGTVSLNAGTSVTIAGSGVGGNAVNVSSSTGTGGTVLVTAPTSIAMTALGGANIAANGANGGTITFTANAGTISTFDGVSARGGLSATGSGDFNKGGTVTLTSLQNTTIGTVNVSGINLASGGIISLTSTSASVDASNLTASGYANVAVGGLLTSTSNGGSITVTANSGSVTIGTVNNNSVGNGPGAGASPGFLTVNALSGINVTGAINMLGLNGGNGGIVNITNTGASSDIQLQGGANLSTDNTTYFGLAGIMTVVSGRHILVSGPIFADAYGTDNYAGVIQLNAANNITSTGSIFARGLQDTGAESGYAKGGRVGLVSTSGTISLSGSGQINVSSAGDSAGGVVLSAGGTGTAVNITTDTLASGSGLNNFGGSVLVKAANGSVALGSIDARGLNGAFSGAVTIGANGSVTAGSSTGVQGISVSGDAGSASLVISAAQAIATSVGGSLNLNASSTSGRGGYVNIAAGGNNGSVSVDLDAINTSGTSGGDVQIVSLDTAGMSTTVGAITSQSTGATSLSGSVGIAALGAVNVTGTIDTRNTNASASAPARSGSVFISSARTTGTTIAYTSINAYNSANGSGSGTVILATSASSASAISPLPSGSSNPFIPANVTVQSGNSAVFVGLPSVATTLLNQTVTITVTPTSISGYNPAGFNSITNGTINFNTNGDSRAIIPIMTLGTVTNPTLTKVNGVTADSITMVTRGNILFTSTNTSTTGTTSGGSQSFTSLTGNFTVNGQPQMLANGGLSGGNVSYIAPLGEINYVNSGSVNANTSTSGTVEAGNFVAVAGANVRVSGIDASSALNAGNATMVATVGNVIFHNAGLNGLDITTASTSGKAGHINLIVGKSVDEGSINPLVAPSAAGIYQMQGAGQVIASTNSGTAGNINLSIITGNNFSHGLGCCGIAKCNSGHRRARSEL